MEALHRISKNCRTTEVDTATERMLAAFEQYELAGDVHLRAFMDELRGMSAGLTRSINKITAESDLEEKDEARDGVVRSIHYLMLGFLQYPDATIKAAAEKVDAVFGTYGLEIIHESYARESSLIESLLTDFAEPALVEAIAVLPGLSQLVGNLRATQTGFEQAKSAYEKEKAQKGSLSSATEMKKKILSFINEKLVVYLRAMVLVDEPKYGAFVSRLGQVIEETNGAVKRRKTKTETPAV